MDIAVDLTNKKIETDRIILRAFKEKDIEDLFEYASVEGVGEMAGWKHHETIDVSNKILENFIAEKDVFAIVYKENNKVVGSLGLHHSWANEDDRYKCLKVKEIGYVLAKGYWGKGLMPEAVKAVIPFCFNEYELDAVTCSHFDFNAQSKRVIEKCGFSFVKEQEYTAIQLQKTFNEKNYILLRSNIIL